MYLQHLLLHIFQKFGGQRSEIAAYHLLRGKRSGQTIQDVGTFDLYTYFSIIPKLSKDKFNRAVKELLENGWIFYDEMKTLHLTSRGIDLLKKSAKLNFNGWYYRGNEHIFYKRLSLIVQTLSHIHANDWHFTPIQKEEEIQIWVKNFLNHYSYKESSFRLQFRKEIEESIKQLQLAEESKQIVILRLTGYRLTGWTWQQLANQLDRSESDVQLMFVELLQTWLDTITFSKKQYPLLEQLAENVRIKLLLTDSTKKTADLYERGYTLEQIANIRQLKISTIEDHFVEMAMSEPHFPILQFIQEEDIAKVKVVLKETGSKRLKVIREQVPYLSYFQIRLVIASKGGK